MEESGFFPAVLNSANLPDSRANQKCLEDMYEREEEKEERKKIPPTMRFGSDLGIQI